MLPTINSRLLAILLGFALLLGAGVVATQFVLGRQADDALVVNLSGRQRMLTQKMSKEAAELALLRVAANPDEARISELRDQLQNSMRIFELTLFALRDGGPAPLNLELTRIRQTPGARTPAIAQQLEQVGAVWEPFKRAMTALIHSSGRDLQALRSVLDTNLTLLEQMNQAVVLMQLDSEQRVRNLLLVQACLLGVGLLLVAFGAFVARSSIARPLLELSAAARRMSTGDLSVELEPRGTREVRELGASFARMRVSMLAMLAGRLGPVAVEDDL